VQKCRDASFRRKVRRIHRCGKVGKQAEFARKMHCIKVKLLNLFGFAKYFRAAQKTLAPFANR